MLYYLKQEVIGNEFQKVFDGVDARWTIEGSFLLVYFKCQMKIQKSA